MKKLYVVIDTGYVNVDLKFEFEVDEDTEIEDYEYIRECAESCIKNNLEWHVEDEDDEEVEIW